MNIKDAHNRKLERYGSLVADLKSAGYKVELSCVEIGSRGLIINDNKTRINTIFKFAGSKPANHFSRTWPNIFSCVATLCGISDTSPFGLNATTSKFTWWFGSVLTLCLFCFLPLWCLVSAVPLCLVLWFFILFVFCFMSLFFFFVYLFVCFLYVFTLPELGFSQLVSWVFMYLLCFLLNKV